MTGIEKYSFDIKQMAYALGFDHCGIAKAALLDEDARRLESWLNQHHQGSMHYMENYFDLRIDPRNLFPGAKSVITVLKNYYSHEHQPTGAPKVSKYAFGKDYHEVIRARLKELMHQINSEIGEVNGRGFVDSAPVLERAWAVRSGMGWIGKNGNLIHKGSGSFYFIANLIVDIELKYDDRFAKDFCGNCHKCIDACPTEAIQADRIINGSKCISYFTIELKDALIPESMKGKFNDWMFGCDICQDICPWNRFSKPNTEADFRPISELMEFKTEDWNALTEEIFKRIFRDSPIKRSKFTGIQRNLKFIEQV